MAGIPDVWITVAGYVSGRKPTVCHKIAPKKSSFRNDDSTPSGFPSPPAILPQPELHGFGIEADQVAEFDRGEAGLAHGAEGAFAATEVAAKVRGGPEAVLVGRLTGWGGGDDCVFRR